MANAVKAVCPKLPVESKNPKAWQIVSMKFSSKSFAKKAQFGLLLFSRLLYQYHSISNLIHFVQLLRNCCLAPSIHAAFVRHEAKEQWLDDAQTYAIDGTEGSHPTQVLANVHPGNRYICHLKKRKIINSNMANEIWDSSREGFGKIIFVAMSKTPANRT